MGADIHPLFGGCGGVYFLAEPGELLVEVEKRDRNTRSTTTELRAILVGPDRRVLQEAAIPDDGQPVQSGLGPPGRVVLAATVQRRGVYALNITVSNDRYGQDMVWGFRTNCPKYLIETARGHKDERHQEPIVPASPGKPATVCFSPRKGVFNIEASGLPKDGQPLQVLDERGAVMQALKVDANGKATGGFPADPGRGASPWRLQLPSAQATLSIDGVTRWDPSDALPDQCLWTPDPASWFPFPENRWLLTPYSKTVYEPASQESQVALQVHNNSDRERRVRLEIEFPGEAWPVQLQQQQVTVGPKQATPVTVRCSLPGDGGERTCHIRATPLDDAGFSTYSTLTVKPGPAPALAPLTMPLVLKAYQHENEQFGYLPDYPVDNQVYFDGDNRPCVRTSAGVSALRDGRWMATELRTAVTSRSPAFEDDTFSVSTTKIAFDRGNRMYLLSNCAGTSALLCSRDGGRSFAAYGLPGRGGGLDIEQFSGHNVPEGPPPFVRLTRTATDPNLRWRSLNDLELFVPREVDGRIEVGPPILITRQCIGLSSHSGTPSSVVSRGTKVHVAWGEATDPQVKVPGVPTYVVTYDRATGQLGKPALIGHGPPPNDGHNSPSITMDSEGYLHVLVGTHGRPFQYARSLRPNDAGGGWTEAVPPGPDLNQTYIGFVCGKDNTLHVTFRLWRSGEPFPHSTHATLAYQRKRPGQPWEPPKILVVSPFSEYSIFYHRLTIDRQGRLFLSYDYWSTYWFYRNDHFGRRRALLMSPDGGDTWKLVDARDWTAGRP